MNLFLNRKCLLSLLTSFCIFALPVIQKFLLFEAYEYHTKNKIFSVLYKKIITTALYISAFFLGAAAGSTVKSKIPFTISGLLLVSYLAGMFIIQDMITFKTFYIFFVSKFSKYCVVCFLCVHIFMIKI